MDVIDHLFAVIPMLGILIMVHELGHFIVAKACGVRVLKFSIGFGAPIGFGAYRLRWERSGTEYVVGWIPLGGFVRMLGEPMPGDDNFAPPVPEDATDDEFLESKPVWQKLSIVFAGPVMNLLLPILCLMGILWVGLPRQDAVVGMVEANSPAAEAGIEAGDRILSLEGEPVVWWEEVVGSIYEKPPGESVLLEIERDGARESVEIEVAGHTALDRFGSTAESGWIGIGHRRLSALVGVPSESSLAAIAGLRSGDLVTAVGETPVADWEALKLGYREAVVSARASGLRTIRWTVERHSEKVFGAVPEITESPQAEGSEGADPSEGTEALLRPAAENLEFEVSAAESLQDLGLVAAPILVHWVQPGMPAARAGLRANDLILSVDDEPIGSFESFASLVQTSGGRELSLTYSRDGQVANTRLRAEETVVAGPYDIEGMEQKVYRVGISNALSSLPGSTSTDRVRNPIASLPRSVEMSWRMTADFLEGLGKLFTGEVGTDQLSGPIGIARIARKSLDRGWLEYVFMMMLISINLGILNLLPIPILDGGQALIYSIEGIKRSPVSMRTREIATQMGFALLVVLMGRAFWNDLTPFWSQFVLWLSESP
jgi:regulator of sigma E protease